MATKKPRYTVSVDDEMFNAIENFRFENRFQTRSEATVELIRLGMEQLKKEQEAAKKAQKNKASDSEAKTALAFVNTLDSINKEKGE